MTNGSPTKINAITSPRWVYVTFIPSFSRPLPSQPLSEYNFESVMPATAVGSAKGSSMNPSKIRFPGKSYLTNVHATISPNTALSTAATNEQPMLVRKAFRTFGFQSSAKNSRGEI